ncbi:MAG: carboxymuconolactone decarboxylase family protein [Flavobacteriales bacterium]|nr:carboxymuconolactone decarboxylase family protein [Flavobacteriales bacterium]
MKTRLIISDLEPKAYEAMSALEKYLSTSTIEPELAEVIRLRASQINGCAYCIEIHSKMALDANVPTKKLFALSAWWESPLFSEKEKAALKMTDEITQISNAGVGDDTFGAVSKHFTKNEIAQIIMLIGTVNIWNRMAISTHLFHEE